MFDLPDLPEPLGFDLPDPPVDVPHQTPENTDEPAPAIREPDEILAPDTLVPVDAILQRVEGITAADVARSVALADRALRVKRLATDDEQAALDALRDEMQAHERHVREQIDPYCDIANRLHKGMTGLRNVALDRVPEAIKHAGGVLGTYLREKREAEERRQREERERALAAERERLRLEAEAAEAERKRIEQQAAETQSRDEQRVLREQAEQLRLEAEQARVEAATATAPPVAARPVAAPAGASTRDNWQALPEHAESWADMPTADKVALIVHVADLCRAGNLSLVNLLSVNTTACNQTAKAQKSTMKVPGIRAVNPAVYSKRR